MGISVIIPVHNSLRYLDECIMSVLKQADEDTEVILVENGSTDASPKRCRQYADQDKRIRYIELGPVGVSVARNQGIEAATKEWITFLDSDDMLQDGAFTLINSTENQEIEILLAEYRCQICPVNTEYISKPVDSDLLVRSVLQFAKYHHAVNKVLTWDSYNNWSCWAKFFKRSFLLKYQIRFPQGIAYSEDTVFCLQCYLHARFVCGVNSVSYFYRPNEFSVTAVRKKSLADNNKKLLEHMESIRRMQLNDSFEKEFNAFYARKIVEVFLDEPEKIKILLEVPYIKGALMKACSWKLIVGKKNTIRYGSALLRLKLDQLLHNR